MPHLENWSVVCHPYASPYTPPEKLGNHLFGICCGHPHLADLSDTPVTTSRIAAFSWALREATTKSGTHYTLGQPDPKWLQWLKDSGLTPASYDKDR